MPETFAIIDQIRYYYNFFNYVAIFEPLVFGLNIMEHKILIVDDDDEFLDRLVKLFKASQNIFDTVTAADGVEALNILKTTTISLVVSDVQMPVMDGFILMAYISGLYPDIPVIMINDPGEVGAEEIALESGAVAYLEKPFTLKELLHTISDTFEKMTDGGQLANVSLEMFIQLFEMEQKTCTVRVQDKETNKTGALFFKDGELYNARISEIEGNEAAYEIISWEKISVSISDTCMVDDKLIDGDNQTIMLEAARRKEAKNRTDDSTNSDEKAQVQEILDSGSMDAKGDKLTNVSLETFVQLFEMEEKSCSLTVENPKNNLKGVLYFKNGDLIDAQLNYITGKEAALKILSWEKVSVEIEYDSGLPEKRIYGDLQGILLEAMRLRDEVEMAEEDFTDEVFEGRFDPRDDSPDVMEVSGEQVVEIPNTPRGRDVKPSAKGVEKAEKSSLAVGLKKIWSRLTK